MLSDAGFDMTIVRYFSTQSRLFQPIGASLGVKNTFGIVACRRGDAKGTQRMPSRHAVSSDAGEPVARGDGADRHR
jgi:hypothetical protein